MTDSNATLLPCPFCGGEAYDHAGILIGGKKESVHIICEACGAKVYGITEAKAIEAWNTRAERTCELVGSYYYDEYDQYEFEFSCGHSVNSYDKELPNYCPNCGKEVKR